MDGTPAKSSGGKPWWRRFTGTPFPLLQDTTWQDPGDSHLQRKVRGLTICPEKKIPQSTRKSISAKPIKLQDRTQGQGYKLTAFIKSVATAKFFKDQRPVTFDISSCYYMSQA